MELSSSDVKKNSYIFSKESFSYISGNGTFLYFRKQKPRKKFLYFGKRKLGKNSLTKLSYISENGNPRNILYFRK